MRNLPIALLLVASMARTASARVVVTMGDAERTARAVTQAAIADPALSRQLDQAMSTSGIPARRIPPLKAAILKRLAREAYDYGSNLDGQIFEGADGARRAVERRFAILRFDAVNQPTLFAAGAPLRYRITDPEAARLARSLPAVWNDRLAGRWGKNWPRI